MDFKFLCITLDVEGISTHYHHMFRISQLYVETNLTMKSIEGKSLCNFNIICIEPMVAKLRQLVEILLFQDLGDGMDVEVQ